MNHDHVQPLRAGDVELDGLEIVVDTRTLLPRAWADPTIDVVEIGLFNYACGRAPDAEPEEGLSGLVAIPFFIRRAFAHRHVYIPSTSALRSFADLRGRRVGTNMWRGSANFWTRDAFRDADVDIEEIQWVVAPLRPDGAIPDEVVPSYVRQERRPGKSLLGMVTEGELDAFVFPAAPDEVFSDGSIIHLLRNYVEEERRYVEKTRIFPAQHIIAIREPLARQKPGLAREVFEAFEASRRLWEQQRRFMAETSPWLLHDLELSASLMGDDWQPNGVTANEAMLARLCEGIAAEHLVTQAPDPAELFKDFDLLYEQGGNPS